MEACCRKGKSAKGSAGPFPGGGKKAISFYVRGGGGVCCGCFGGGRLVLGGGGVFGCVFVGFFLLPLLSLQGPQKKGFGGGKEIK